MVTTSPGKPAAHNPPTPNTWIRSAATGRTYIFGEKKGGGQFGDVYECTDDWENKLAAKVLLPKGTQDEVRARWNDEFNKLIRLRHPHITYIHDLFEYQETFYIVMERCSFSLEDLLQSNESTDHSWLIMPLARCILQAVHYIHQEGFVHKDLHAGNIFASEQVDALRPEGRVWTFKVGDLGISRLIGDINPFNTVLANWMLPPEAIEPAQFGVVGRETDIYHLGLLFLRILARRKLTYTREEIIAGLPRQHADALDSPYAVAIGKCLRRRVSFRTKSALELWADLRAVNRT